MAETVGGFAATHSLHFGKEQVGYSFGGSVLARGKAREVVEVYDVYVSVVVYYCVATVGCEAHSFGGTGCNVFQLVAVEWYGLLLVGGAKFIGPRVVAVEEVGATNAVKLQLVAVYVLAYNGVHYASLAIRGQHLVGIV